MSKKRTTLHSTAIAERKSPSSTTSAIDIASNHNAPTVGKPTKQTPDTFSIVDMTERVVELEVVNNVLLPRQRNTDKELTMDDPGEAKASPWQMTDNKEKTPFFTRYTHLVPTAKSQAPESKEDELSSSNKGDTKEFDKKQFLLGFQITISEVIWKLLEDPTKNHGEKQCRKNLRKKEAKHLTDDTGAGSVIMWSRAASHLSGNTENVIHHLVRADSEVSDRVQRKIGTEAEHWAAIEKDTAQQKHQAIQIDQEVTEAELQDAYLQGKQPEKIQAATLRTRAVKYELNKIQWLEAAGLTSSSPNDPHYVKVLNRGNPITDKRSAPVNSHSTWLEKSNKLIEKTSYTPKYWRNRRLMPYLVVKMA